MADEVGLVEANEHPVNSPKSPKDSFEEKMKSWMELQVTNREKETHPIKLYETAAILGARTVKKH